MDAYTTLYTAGGVPALVSTAITIIYFAVKLITYVFNAERPKARKGHCTIVYPDTTRAQRAERKALAKFTRIYQDTITKQMNMAEGSGHSQPGPYFYTQNGKTYASLPLEMIKGIRQCPHYEQMLKDMKAEGVHIPETILAQDPKAHILTPQEYLQKVEEGTMPPTRNHNIMKEMAEKAGKADQTKFVLMEFTDFQRPERTETPALQQMK